MFLAAGGAIVLFSAAKLWPPKEYDDLYNSQQTNQQLLDGSAFASGYFPPEYADPSIDCGYGAGRMPIISDVETEWYPGQLSAAREPSLYLLSRQAEPPEFALRFSLIPSFDPSMFVRIYKEGPDYWLVVKHLSGAGGYEPGSIAASNKRRLSESEVSRLMELLAKLELFEESKVDCVFGFDGSRLLFEQVDEDGYAMVNRWSPDEGKALELGEFLIGLSGWAAPRGPSIATALRELIAESF